MSEYSDDAYKTLGVSPTATEREIKTAYRKLALQYHPDRQSDDKQREIATTKFVKIANAYEVLTDPHLRAEYDERRQSDGPTTTAPTATATTTTSSFPFKGNKKKTTTAQTTSEHTPFRYHFSDPYEVFKRDFREQFGVDYPGAKYDWIDFNEPIVAPANKTNSTMITNGTSEELQQQPKKKGFNLFRRKQKDDSRQLVVHNGTDSSGKALALSGNTCTDIVLAEKRNNRPISMDVQTTTDGTITTTRTTITRPDGSTETVTMKTGIPGKAPIKPSSGPPLKQLTNGVAPRLVTNGTTTQSPRSTKNSSSTALVKKNPTATNPTNKQSQVKPQKQQQQQQQPNKAKIGRIGAQ